MAFTLGQTINLKSVVTAGLPGRRARPDCGDRDRVRVYRGRPAARRNGHRWSGCLQHCRQLRSGSSSRGPGRYLVCADRGSRHRAGGRVGDRHRGPDTALDRVVVQASDQRESRGLASKDNRRRLLPPVTLSDRDLVAVQLGLTIQPGLRSPAAGVARHATTWCINQLSGGHGYTRARQLCGSGLHGFRLWYSDGAAAVGWIHPPRRLRARSCRRLPTRLLGAPMSVIGRRFTFLTGRSVSEKN